MDIYDEEFTQHMALARNLIIKIKRKRDREICTKWIRKLCALQSYDPVVKKNRNHFFKYMLTVVHRGITKREGTTRGHPQHDDTNNQNGSWNKERGFISLWSADKKTYVAAKPLPGKGALVYMAIAKDPSLGWERPMSLQ